ncbi:MAG: ATP-dependent DNA ligase [Proteobacteria bacterium]|nr:ATP-dependent DNA ligase [Pseudomonadota bacterium]
MRFVIHEHHATHLHWDLRLELDGALKSWAVPKEPPAEAGTKRLAIQVEDHPLDYIDFEGVIEEGYGKGEVKIWDKGELAVESRAKNKIVFFLYGKKLAGKFTLLKFAKAGENGWLFFKVKEG